MQILMPENIILQFVICRYKKIETGGEYEKGYKEKNSKVI